jgi:putative DNA primase/helicase
MRLSFRFRPLISQGRRGRKVYVQWRVRTLASVSNQCGLSSEGDTGTSDHDPELLMTKIASGCYRPGFTHIDWAKALEALPKEERDWLQCVVGQGITGHPNPNDFMAVLQGSGENGKSAITTDGILPALGDYASVASTKLFHSSKSEHSTERADLLGKRVVIIEELTEGKSIDTSALKQILGVAYITARFIRQDNITFRASHTLIATTNYIPIVNETDWGTWRRFALLRFPIYVPQARSGTPKRAN